MGLRHEQYAKALVETHGAEHAEAIVADCLNIATKRNFELFYYDEVEWAYNAKTNTLNFPRETNRKGKSAGRRDRRIADTKNFYAAVMVELKRLGKNGRVKKGN